MICVRYNDIEVILTSEKKAISVNPTTVDVFEPLAVYPLRGAPDNIMIFRMKVRMKAVVVLCAEGGRSSYIS